MEGRGAVAELRALCRARGVHSRLSRSHRRAIFHVFIFLMHKYFTHAHSIIDTMMYNSSQDSDDSSLRINL